jgi:hypothetical protein
MPAVKDGDPNPAHRRLRKKKADICGEAKAAEEKAGDETRAHDIDSIYRLLAIERRCFLRRRACGHDNGKGI